MPCALAVCAAFPAARPRAPSITAIPSSGGVVSVSGHGGVPPWPGPTKLSRSFVLHRGHASRAAPAALPLRGISPGSSRQASPLCPTRCVVVPVGGNGRVRPLPSPRSVQVSAAGGRRVMSHAPATGTRFAFTYCAVLQSVRSRFAKAPLGAAHRCAPCRVYKTHNMQSALRWGWAPQPSALPGRLRALRADGWSPRRGGGPLALVRRYAQGFFSGLRPGATCVPPPTPQPRRCAASARPPPWGLPQLRGGYCGTMQKRYPRRTR